MTQAGVLKFIIIDDDSINNFLVKIILKKLTVNSNVESFTDSELMILPISLFFLTSICQY